MRSPFGVANVADPTEIRTLSQPGNNPQLPAGVAVRSRCNAKEGGLKMIKPELIHYVRTMIRGDYAANESVGARLDAEGWDGFPRFLAALFFVAVDRRFGETADRLGVIKFVADLRVQYDGGPEIRAEDAESLILATIDPSLDYAISQEMIGRIQAATVQRILTDEALADAELEALLADAGRLTSRS
ncbi:hypothetical protein [Micromonospora sp. NPDC049102]|uniref:hypothetical protein n=1 Tax=Micromonospora sp. NPDC049102 TaxID=3364265 RepID=UPI003715009C